MIRIILSTRIDVVHLATRIDGLAYQLGYVNGAEVPPSTSNEANAGARMHELALSRSIVERVLELAGREGMRAVTRVDLEVGRLAGVEIDALRFCFDAVTRATAAEGAELVVEDVPGEGMCMDCHLVFNADQAVVACPQCSGWRVQWVRGRELRLKTFTGESDAMRVGNQTGVGRRRP